MAAKAEVEHTAGLLSNGVTFSTVRLQTLNSLVTRLSRRIAPTMLAAYTDRGDPLTFLDRAHRQAPDAPA